VLACSIDAIRHRRHSRGQLREIFRIQDDSEQLLNLAQQLVELRGIAA
jgi:hypothetical protein